MSRFKVFFGQSGSAAAAYTVTADAGSYAVTGSAATLQRKLPIVAAAGSYVVTGTAASLKLGRKAVAAAGSYSVTGTAASLKYGRNVGAAVSSYAVTGQAASLIYNRRIIAAAGSYAVTGTAATLLVTGVGARILVAGVSSYAVTGTAATLKRGSLIAAAASSYAVTGVAASLKRGLKNTAAAGSYLVSGQAASLAKSSGGNKTLVAGAGSYSTDVEGAILGTVSNPNNQFTVLRRPGDPLYEQIIIWSDFDLVRVTDPDHFERLEYIGITSVDGTSYHTFRVHFRDLTTTVVTLGSSPFATTNGSPVVRVTHTAHGRRTGEFVRISGASSVGGFQVGGSVKYEYQITYVSDNTYDITQRSSIVMGGNPFAMTNGSAVVRVTHTGHGRSTGDIVFYSDADYAGGIRIAGTYSLTFVDANHYDITHGSAATSTTTGGGTSITASYEIRATSTATGGGSSVVATYNEFKIVLDATYSYAEAEALALTVAPRLGKLPRLYRQNLNLVYVHTGSVAFSAGEAQFTLSEDRIAIRVAYKDLEESCLHEATHATIDEHYQGKGIAYNDHPGWEAAVAADDAYIDDYAASDDAEDFAQSALASYAMMTHPERFPEPDRTLISNQIPNRLAFFRNTVFTDHITACARVPAANVASKMPTRFIDSLVNNTSLLSHCRVLANLKVEAYYSRPDLVAAGIPDLYKFVCNTCGRVHPRTCNGDEPRAYWDAR